MLLQIASSIQNSNGKSFLSNSLSIFGPISKFKDNVSTHYFWLIENNQMNSHFNIWRENLTIEKQKELFGIELPFQYAGRKIWYHYFFLRMIPFIYIIYLN